MLKENTVIINSFNILLSLFLIIFLLIKRQKFPFNNISSKLVILVITSILLQQIFYTFFYFFDYFNLGDIFLCLRLTIIVNIHYFTSFPLMFRTYILYVSFKYSFYHLTERNYDEKFQRKSYELFKRQYYASNQYATIYKIMVFPILLFITMFVFLICSKEIRCFLMYYSTLFKPEYCVDYNSLQMFVFIKCLEELYFFIETFFLLTCIFNVLKYPIKRDRFKVRFEIIMILILWSVNNNLIRGVKIFYNEKIDYKTYLLLVSIQDLSFNLLYLYLIYSRSKIEKNMYMKIINNYDLFMQNNLCFAYLKEYIKNYHEDASIYVAFWVDFYIFKLQINQCKNQMLFSKEKVDKAESYNNKIAQLAFQIYYDYFFNESSRTSINISSQSHYLIDFPVDIQETVEDAAQVNFMVDDLNEIYDEAFMFVNNKLNNVYLSLLSNEKEYSKIEKMLSYVDMDEVKSDCQFEYGRKTSLN